MSETKKRLYHKSTLQRKLNELLERVTKLNSGLDNTYDYLYYVKKVVVFGSFLDETKDKMHDLDIGIELKLKPEYKDYTVIDLEKARVETMPIKFFNDSRGLLQGIWPFEEVLRYLKNKSGIYSFHDLAHKGEYKIIMSSRTKTVYDIDVEGEKERLYEAFEDDKENILYRVLIEKGREVLNDVLVEFRTKLQDIQIELKEKFKMPDGYTHDDLNIHKEAYQELMLGHFESWITKNMCYMDSNNIPALIDLRDTLLKSIADAIDRKED